MPGTGITYRAAVDGSGEAVIGDDRVSRRNRVSLRSRMVSAAVLSAACLVPLLTWWRGSQLVWGLDGSFPVRLVDVNRYFALGSTAYAAPDARKLSFIIPWGLILRGWEALGLPWDAAAAQRFFEVGLLLASAFGCRAFVRKLFPHIDEAASTLAALFYVANAYALTTVWVSQSYLIVHYSFLPALAVLVAGSFESGGLLRWLATGLGWTLMMSPAYITTPLVVTDVAAIAMIGILAVFAREVSWRRVTAAGAVILGSWFVLNLYWIVPLARDYRITFAQGIASISGTRSVSLFHLNSAPLLAAMRLGGYWGITGSIDGSAYYSWAGWDTQWVNLVAYVPIAFGAVALLAAGTRFAHDPSRRAQRTVGVLAVCLVLLLFLVTGSTGPLAALKVDAFRATDLLDPFRSVYQRFMEYMPLVLAPLMAAGIDVVKRVVGRRSAAIGMAGRSAIWGAGLLVVILVPLPWWDGGMFGRSGMLPSNRMSVPASYARLASRIPKGGGSILTLPIGTTNVTYLRWAHGANGFMGIQPLSFMTSLPMLDQAPSGSYVRGVLAGGMETGALCPALQRLNVDYVAFEADASPALMAAVHGYLGVPLARTAAMLSAAPCLRRFGSGDGLTVYRDVRWIPALVSFGQSPVGPGVPANYQIHAGNVITVDNPGLAYRYLILNEPNDGGWVLNGNGPVPGHDVTAFRIQPGVLTRLVLANQTTSEMRRLLAFSGALVLAIGGALVVQRVKAWQQVTAPLGRPTTSPEAPDEDR